MNDILKAIVYGGLFIVPFLTLFVADSLFFPYITGKNFAFRIIIEVVTVSWILLAFSDPKYRPKFSWVISAFSLLVVVMFFANLFSKHPDIGFWSNFERMDGYVTLIHVFLYSLVLGSAFTTKKIWLYYLNTTLAVASMTALYGLAQYAGMTENYNGRIDSFLGNAAYFAVYMLFHIFIALWLTVESKSKNVRVVYSILIVLFTFALLESGTRGTTVGLAVGIAVILAYISLFGAKYIELRKYMIGGLIALVTLVGLFFAGKDLPFIQQSNNLSRIANINLQTDLWVRTTIWGMAWEGVKERPLLGWGQGNFNYVFNQNYKPTLYGQEQWFDRTHNIVMDWLIAGGFLGLIAYFSIFVACLYYLFYLPLVKKDEEKFTVLERAVLLGILAGYLVHNLVVFDNIISYIFFAIFLAIIHSRVARSLPAIEGVAVDQKLVKGFLAPVLGVLLVALIYTMQIPGIKAASDIIDGYRSPDWNLRYESFSRAVERDAFAYQEITEQIAQQAMNIANDPNVPNDVRQKFIALAEKELLELIEAKPGDARIHVFAGTFYRALGNLDKAKEQMDIARSLSPKKQSIISQQGIVAYSQGNLTEARDLFREAFELDQGNLEAREYYAAMLYANKDNEAAQALVETPAHLERLAMNDFLLSAANDAGDKEFLINAYKLRIEKQPTLEQNWMSLAFLYNEVGEKNLAVNTLREAAVSKPSFAKMANCVADNIEKGRAPEEGCRATVMPGAATTTKN